MMPTFLWISLAALADPPPAPRPLLLAPPSPPPPLHPPSSEAGYIRLGRGVQYGALGQCGVLSYASQPTA